MRNGTLRKGDMVRVKNPERWEGSPSGDYVVRDIYQKDGRRKDWCVLAMPGMGEIIGTFAAQDLRQ